MSAEERSQDVQRARTLDSSHMCCVSSSTGSASRHARSQPCSTHSKRQCGAHRHQQRHCPWHHGLGRPLAGPVRARCGWSAVAGPRHRPLPLHPQSSLCQHSSQAAAREWITGWVSNLFQEALPGVVKPLGPDRGACACEKARMGRHSALNRAGLDSQGQEEYAAGVHLCLQHWHCPPGLPPRVQ